MNVEWIALEAVLIYHDRQITEHGGAEGIRDEAALQSALARPCDLLAYGDPDLFDLAAAYARGIVQNHPFVDGNKRMALVVAASFLDLNGQELTAPEAKAAAVFLRLAAGEIEEAEPAECFRRNCMPADATFLVAEQDQ